MKVLKFFELIVVPAFGVGTSTGHRWSGLSFLSWRGDLCFLSALCALSPRLGVAGGAQGHEGGRVAWSGGGQDTLRVERSHGFKGTLYVRCRLGGLSSL